MHEVFSVDGEKVEEQIILGLLVFLGVQIKNHRTVVGFIVLLSLDKATFEGKLVWLIFRVTEHNFILILVATHIGTVEEHISILNLFQVLHASLLQAVNKYFCIVNGLLSVERIFGDLLYIFSRAWSYHIDRTSYFFTFYLQLTHYLKIILVVLIKTIAILGFNQIYLYHVVLMVVVMLVKTCCGLI